jgi:hypothetical protein
MGALYSIDVEVEFVLTVPRSTRLVVVRPLSAVNQNFVVTGETTIGGYPVEELTQPPRMCNPDGSPRLDVLAFRLRSHEDCTRLVRGQQTTVRGLRIVNDGVFA